MSFRIRAAFLLPLFLVLGCGASSPAVAPAAAEVKTFAHDLRHVQHDCVNTGMCVSYTFAWPAHSHVAFELHTEGFPGVLILTKGGAPEERFAPDSDGVIRTQLDLPEATTVRLLVAGKGLGDRGPTRLVVSGPPAKEIALPKPPPSEGELEAARKADEQAKREELAMVYAKVTAGFTREPAIESGDLGAPKDLKIPLRRGRCYKVFLSIEDLGSALAWSPRIDARWRGMSSGGGVSPVTHKSVLGSASDELCPTSDGSATVAWNLPDLAKSKLKGPYRMEIWTRTLSEKELKGVDAKEHGLVEDIGARGCNVCRANAHACLTRPGGGCMDRFRACLEENGVPANRCHY